MTRKVKTLAGTPGVFGYKDGLNPLFNEPLGLVLTEDGNVIVCDSKNGALRYVSRENGETITLVGRPSSAIIRTMCTYSYRNSIANRQYLSRRRTGVGNYASFRFELPYGLLFVDDVLLVTDAGSGRIYALDSHFEMVHCLNDLAPGLGNLDGPLRASTFRRQRAFPNVEQASLLLTWSLTVCGLLAPQRRRPVGVSQLMHELYETKQTKKQQQQVSLHTRRKALRTVCTATIAMPGYILKP